MSDPTISPEDSRGGGAEHQLGVTEIQQFKTALDSPPQQIGPYRILETISEGGMGTVYKAEQRHPIKRTVAIKGIKVGFNMKEVIARFESERQVLARMDHPNVAKVLDAGADDQGRPFFVMEWVPGVPITRFCDDNKLSIKDRLLLFIQACEAIAHAHTKGIIHRDIKASNVLAYLQDGTARLKVIDFGIAKALTGDKLTDVTFNTNMGGVVGTYETMSPEQAEGSPDIDTRTDVYSLGVLLYELLSGVKPLDHETLARAGDQEIRRLIREVEPPRPSTRLSSLGEDATKIAAMRREHLDALSKQLRSELEWIPLKAMRKERDRRYASPLELAQDIQSYLEGKPLLAGPESHVYRARKFVGRNRRRLVGSAVVVLLLTTGIGFYVVRIRLEQLRTEAALILAQRERSSAELAKKRLDNSYETTNRVHCQNRMRRIGRAIQLYADSHEEVYPRTLESLLSVHTDSRWWLDAHLEPLDLSCPGASGGQDSYIYLGGKRTSASADAMAATVILYEPPGNHRGGGSNFLFEDGHAEFFESEAADYIIKQLQAGINPPKFPGK